jgi:hypothetical protein
MILLLFYIVLYNIKHKKNVVLINGKNVALITHAHPFHEHEACQEPMS